MVEPPPGARRRASLSPNKAGLRDASEVIDRFGHAVLGRAEELRQWIEKLTSKIGEPVRPPRSLADLGPSHMASAATADMHTRNS
ncbi:MAG: hypothetical protein LN413_04630 [Candidatus Thermoplasmatota archaeon]|nr:hypothetical protein [Candidatus Thermoplasmatota archaeon]